MASSQKTVDFHLQCWEKNPLTKDFAITGTIGLLKANSPRPLLELDWHLSGPVKKIIFPKNAKPARKDDLWKMTCVEIFAGGPHEAYWEYNLSPSSQWAVYHFDRYRKDQTRPEIAAPRVIRQKYESTAVHFKFQVDLGNREIPECLGITTVLEHESGELSYWALTHTSTRPDFHQRNSFVISADQLV